MLGCYCASLTTTAAYQRFLWCLADAISSSPSFGFCPPSSGHCFFLFSLHITQCLTVPCPPTTVSCQSTRPAKGMNYLTALRADINTAINAAAVAAALSVAFTVNWQALRPFSATVSLHRAILRSHSHMFNSGSSSSVLLSQTAAINYRWPFNCIYSRGEKSPI